MEAVGSEVGVRLAVVAPVRVAVRLGVLDIDPVTDGVPD